MSNNSKISPQIQRVITGAVIICIFFPVLWFSDTIVFPIAMSILSGIAAFELISLNNQHRDILLFVPAISFASVATLFYGLENYRSYSFSRFYFMILALYLLYLLFISVVRFGKVNTNDIFMALFSGVFPSVAFTSFLYCRNVAHIDYLLIIIAACCTDVAALYAGTLFGKHKLCPKLSPKKTVEGAVGGVVGCMLGFLAYGLILSLVKNETPDYLLLLLVAVPASVTAQFGDLAASALKRNFNVKDYGKIFPGHGGVLDRFDSMLAVAMAVFVFLRIYTYMARLWV